MPVRYIRVNPVSDLFAPAVRAYGNIGIVGELTPPASPPPDMLTVATPVLFTDPTEALRRAPGNLGTSIALAFAQSPGPTVVYGVRVDQTTPDWAGALAALGSIDVQIVCLALTELDATTGASSGAITALADHVTQVSTTGADGMERIGVAMLAKGATDPTIVTGALATERMAYVAHKSDEDVAAAVAGTIAGYQPQISMLLKQVAVDTDQFTPGEIDLINGVESFGSGPAGAGVNWLVSPVLIPGHGVYLGEGYTGNPGGGKKYIDIVRFLDSVSFLLKAQLISSIGNVRISRSGLRALIGQMESVLDPLVSQDILNDYDIVVPLLVLLDMPPASLTAAQQAQITNAQSQRVVEVLVAVDYAGAIHRLDITLKFE
jgi:hypothetical protein